MTEKEIDREACEIIKSKLNELMTDDSFSLRLLNNKHTPEDAKAILAKVKEYADELDEDIDDEYHKVIAFDISLMDVANFILTVTTCCFIVKLLLL